MGDEIKLRKTLSLSLRTKILLAMALVAAVVVGATLATNYHLRRKQLLNDFMVFVHSVAGTTSLALDADALNAIRTAADAESPAFLQARKVLERSRQINGLAEQEIYVLRPAGHGDQWTMEFVVMLQKKSFIGDLYKIPEGNRAKFRDAWTTGLPMSTGIYSDEHGQWISGYAPIFDKTGKPVAVVETDAEVSRFITKQRDELLFAIAVGLGAFFVAMVPGLLLATSITRGLQALSMCVQRFKSGDHEVQSTVASGDELEELSDVFNGMISSLREKLALLPYVSRFTAEAVRRSRDDPSWLTGSEQNVIVLFADLRGFTTFSESRDASVLVRELNSLLSVQADAVLSAGGDIDKFIGDAVMAVFLDAAESAETAFACAQQLIERVRAETRERGWPLGLGIGIHCGRVVVGSIGSETRRDFTAIGHTVNFASRLCDRAEPWEILVSDSFYELLSAPGQTRFNRTEPMQFKNVKQFIATHVCKV